MLDWIKSHPYLAGGAAIGLIVLYFVVRSATSTPAAQVIQTGPTDAQLQANAQLAAIQAQVQAAQQQTTGAVQANQANADTALGIAGLQAQAVKDQSTAAVQANKDTQASQVAQGQTALQAIQAQVAAQTQQAQINASAAANIAGINANAASSAQIVGYNDQLTASLAGTAASVSIADIQSKTQLGLSIDALSGLINTNQTQLGIANAQYNYLTNAAGFALAGLQNTNITNFNIAGLQLQGLEDTNATQLGIAGINANAAVTINSQNNQTQQLGITTYGGIANNLIDTQGALTSQYQQGLFNYLGQQQQNTYNLQIGGLSVIAGGGLNLGGSGGANTVAGFNALFTGQPSNPFSNPGLVSSLGPTLSGLGNLLGGAGNLIGNIIP